jgi:hypothetical protein
VLSISTLKFNIKMPSELNFPAGILDFPDAIGNASGLLSISTLTLNIKKPQKTLTFNIKKPHKPTLTLLCFVQHWKTELCLAGQPAGQLAWGR